MPEIFVREAESIDEALKRFGRAVVRDGSVKAVKQRMLFLGAATESQRRRAKTKKALRRWRQSQKKEMATAYKNRDYDDDKIKAEFWANDTSWATSDTDWHPDLTPIKRSLPTEAAIGPVSLPSPFFRFGEDQRVTNSAEPPPSSTHVCGIGEMTTNGQKAIPIVRSFKEDGKTPRDKFTFPGGGVEKDETPEEAMVREYKEEIGLDVEVVCKIFEAISESMEKGKHTFICFLIRIRGGTLHLGTEIDKLGLIPFAGLVKFREEIQGFSHNHELAFDTYRKKLESGELPQLAEPIPVKTIKKTPSRKRRTPHVSAS